MDISDTTITDATASGDAADVAGYAGVYLEAKSEGQHNTATTSGSTISGSANNGVYVSGAQTLTIDTSTISGSTAGANALNPTGYPALGTGVLATQSAELHVSASAITGNEGPGVIAGRASATVDDSTVSGNGGSAVMLINSAATVSGSTLVQTKPWPEGSQIPFPSAAMFVPESGEPGSGSGPVTVTGSIVAGAGDSLACAAAVTDGGYNLATDDTCKWSAAGSVAKTDPQLGQLADNGGPTHTHIQLPADHSPVVDAIPFGKAGCKADATDQRGVSRPQPGPQGPL